MNLRKLIEKGEVVIEPVIDKCYTFEFTGKNKQNDAVTTTSGPCKRIVGDVCGACISPKAKWRLGNCNLATHIISVEEQKKKLNPIKASKRG